MWPTSKLFGKKKMEKMTAERIDEVVDRILKDVLATVKQDIADEAQDIKYRVHIIFRNGNEAEHGNVSYVDRGAYFTTVYKYDDSEYSYPNKDVLRIKQTKEK